MRLNARRLGRLNDCLSRFEPARRNCILYAHVDGCSTAKLPNVPRRRSAPSCLDQARHGQPAECMA
jgi:hypothetical protein